MKSYDVRVDVTEAVALGEPVETVSTVHLPERVDGPVTVLFGYPGGGYGRRYYDISDIPGYSQAEHHTAGGFVFVACDHVGVGESSQPDTLRLTFENLAAANDAAARTVLDRLRTGTLHDGTAPIDVERVAGMGQSMGGCLLTVQQSNHATFDAVAFLGWSGIETNFPAPDGSRLTFSSPPRGTDLSTVDPPTFVASAPTEEHFRFCFHWSDEESDLVERDLASYRPFSGIVRGDASSPWGSASVPVCAITMMTHGAVASEAAAIDVPVLVASGERDVVPDPWTEPTAYRGSRDVSVVVVPEMAHMHNFARTRTQLWDRIAHFACTAAVRQPQLQQAGPTHEGTAL